MAHQSKTGTSNVTYNLISVAYHALQGAELYQQYESDAREAGDEKCADLFAKAQRQCVALAEETQQHLHNHLSDTQ